MSRSRSRTFSSSSRRWRRAFLTVRTTFSSDSGFSRKSKAPSLVALTAVSTVPWPEMTTTGGRSSRPWISAQDVEAVHPGKPDVEQDQAEGPLGQDLQAVLAGGRGLDVVAFVLQDALERGADAGFVVDDQDAVLSLMRAARW